MPIYPYSFTLPPVNKQDIPSDGVAGEFLGINSGGQLDWLPVSASGSGDMLKADNLLGLASYPTARTNLGLGTGDSPTFANLTLTSPSLGSSAPVTISQTWGNNLITFTGLKFNAAGTSDANSASGSLLADFQLNAVSKASVNKNGLVSVPDSAGTGGFVFRPGNTGSGGIGYLSGGGYGVWAGAGSAIGFSTGAALVGNIQTALYTDGAGQLALRNGANAQTFRVYGAYPDTGINYARLALSCDTSGNATISTQALGTYTAGTVSINGVPVGLGKGNVSSNVAVGTGALSTNTTGTDNVAVGFEALGLGTGSSESVAVGWRAAKGSSTRQVSIGYGANQLGAVDSVSIGWASMFSIAGGSLNVAVGRSSGYFITGGSTQLTSCTKSLFLGCDTKALGQSQENQIVIGYDATGIGSNSVVLGNDSITKTALKGNVGIGTTAPTGVFDVRGANATSTAVQIGGTAANAGNIISLQGNATPGGAVQIYSNYYAAGPEGPLILGAYTNRANQLYLAVNGNVGIGTTSPTSKLHVAETWNAGGTTFAAAKVVVTDTASAAASTLLELWSDAVTPTLKYSFGKSGAFKIFGGNNSEINCNQFVTNSGIAGNTDWGVYLNNSSGIILKDTLSLGWSSGVATLGADTILRRDGEQDHLAMRRGALGQKFSVYGTYPSATAWERFTITAPTSGNVLLGTYRGTGGIARGLEFQTDGVTRMTIAATGLVTIPISILVNSAVRTGFINNVGDSLSMFSFANDSTGTSTYAVGGSAPLMRFGGTTNLFPAIKRSTTYLQARLADDSAFAPIQGKLTTDTAFTAGAITDTGYIVLYDSNGVAYKVACTPV